MDTGIPNERPILVLIHSPLVGPFTWVLVADQLREKGFQGIVPSLVSTPGSQEPYWKRHVSAVVIALEPVPARQPILLIAHSGAGPLLPAIRQPLSQPIAGYLFVDAGWPADGKSRLDQFEDEEAAAHFRQSARDGFLPVWSEEDLKAVIPNDTIRHGFTSELRPLPIRVYEETLPVFPGWPDAPCAYLRFGHNPAYDRSVARAQQSGCRVMQLDGEHFHMLVDPVAVTEAILTLIQSMKFPTLG
jgi:hypothetical protein